MDFLGPEPILVDDVGDLDHLTLPKSKLVRQLGLQALLGLGGDVTKETHN